MKEYPILMGLMMFTALFVILGNLIADIAIAAMDPRVRLS
jgi:peptide/nickel transport system permease protein